MLSSEPNPPRSGRAHSRRRPGRRCLTYELNKGRGHIGRSCPARRRPPRHHLPLPSCRPRSEHHCRIFSFFSADEGAGPATHSECDQTAGAAPSSRLRVQLKRGLPTFSSFSAEQVPHTVCVTNRGCQPQSPAASSFNRRSRHSFRFGEMYGRSWLFLSESTGRRS